MSVQYFFATKKQHDIMRELAKKQQQEVVF